MSLSLMRPGCCCAWLPGDKMVPFLCWPCMPVALVACIVTGSIGSLSAPLRVLTITEPMSGCDALLPVSWICLNLKRRLVCT